MSVDFNADEIFEMAEQIERNGAKFYRRAAEGAGDAGGRKILLDLAAMEDQHEKIFASMRAQLSEDERASTIWDPEGQVPLYLRAIADKRIFDVDADPTDLLSGKEAMDDVLRIAIELEKDSVIFYQGMREVVPQRLGGEWVEEIIREEMRHIGILSMHLSSPKH
ncbi:hypothetical protein AMJ39_05995 [candidate division TA06 bacterium DG_24]|jgi:rubrerythrin|uniref:Uncharacterized protein n=3 Tax=Bacteria division TA06 TaxID=1156500 RepID=A0A0S8JMW0_UNCT6|nr:MAG: hypothetical protein AMJ39_05995 [candidate division TA06 bacterium DG_24]KPK70237.1 MAG: hypothetical protein AMJ82_03625 [candidate division TA06 bacterium SM23_40]KPL09966.1 MAG: hypothetical protein AMJ71_04950 [candidate division TA06 bacterium SM1_40]